MTVIKKGFNDLRNLFFQNALWLVGLGLMLASSGIDGTYMATWMPDGAEMLGYILNTVADISGMAITYYYGVLIRENSKTSKKHKLARVLLGAEAIAVLYQWFFSWRQLIRVLPMVEPVAYQWVAPVSAAFIPLLLAFIGWAQSLIYEPVDTTEKPLSAKVKPMTAIKKPVSAKVSKLKSIGISEFRQLATAMNGDKPLTAEELNQWLNEHGYESKPVSTARRWLKELVS